MSVLKSQHFGQGRILSNLSCDIVEGRLGVSSLV